MRRAEAWGRRGLLALQWFWMMLANALVVPLVVGHAFGLSPAETARFLSATFVASGLGALVQGLFGHRLPIIEGPAGLWWNVFLLALETNAAFGVPPEAVGRKLTAAMLAGGVALFVLGRRGRLALSRLFTPFVRGVFMLVLPLSMSGTFVRGLFWDVGSPLGGAAALSVAVVALGFALSRRPVLRAYYALWSVVYGWGLFAALEAAGLLRPGGAGGSGGTGTGGFSERGFSFPGLFFFGPPEADPAAIVLGVVTAIVLLSNVYASVFVTAEAAGVPAEERPARAARGAWASGVSHVLSGAFGVVGTVPLSISAGVIRLSGSADRGAFLAAAAGMGLVGGFPPVVGWLAGMPPAVGYAVLWVTFTQLVGFGLEELKGLPATPAWTAAVGLSVMLGVGLLFLPPDALGALPPAIRGIAGNGLIVAVLAAIGLERLMAPILRREG
ncbi:MAG: Xanthine permease [Hydrogenibacillus schlegelii]|uniref:Xanthine permease n=1 Tax=Hydrogenibacillus schlegelii TaxID=1484 RepID=A0A2T5GF64_HYDSH|nr:purine/pyrimidine permease [Hydrogenibacillus schlegelii]PTQ54832.1 MAG: Xanthine permease [Hydrogenibacillus schlegelii]